ncbi:PRKC apoptosis WT1 regulator protein-like isoform X3 [Bombus flavifrons]|uniref:PRKC apoptosis WT1 regulator protein-like isoform X3 n=1 Tax=Bombus flavifrons TaxID=103934 RepID=UPI003703BF21
MPCDFPLDKLNQALAFWPPNIVLVQHSDITGMASSSVSQEDFDNDFELTSRRSRIRTARARVVPPRAGDSSSINFQKGAQNVEESQGVCDTSSNSVLPPDHENQQNKPIMRKQDKRVTGRVFSVVSCLHRPTHINKGKQQRDRRKLREKRRSTGVVHLPSTESTGGSTGEDEEDLSGTCLETKHNTHHNEFLDHELIEERTAKMFTQRRNKSHSDLEADDEEFDSLNQSDSVNQSDHGNHEPQASVNTVNQPRLSTPTGDNPHELIERAQEENRRLLSLLEDRDHKIMALEARLLQQQHEMTIERERLREENAALIRAMAALASN